MNYEITWKWDEFSKALHYDEACKYKDSRRYRLYVLFTDKAAMPEAHDQGNAPMDGIPSSAGIDNVLYVGRVTYKRKNYPDYPMRITERILAQGHTGAWLAFEQEPGPIYLGLGAINEPFYTDDKHTKNLEGYLIDRFGPRYNDTREPTTIKAEHTPIRSTIHENSQKTMFTGFMEFEENYL